MAVDKRPVSGGLVAGRLDAYVDVFVPQQQVDDVVEALIGGWVQEVQPIVVGRIDIGLARLTPL